ncbi:MAG: C1 family peptidase [Leptospiraceae bacterium]|nr:C1 family peptidase [Leptospiraceae bacterium]MDW8305976.1 C1 family peptidase [Leptospiraceae bacterium]
MKKVKLGVLLLATSCLLQLSNGNILAQQANKDLLERMAEQRRNLEEFKAKQKQMLETLKEKNYKFRIGLTEANKYRLEQITGLIKPKNLDEDKKKHEAKEKEMLKDEERKKEEFKREHRDQKLPEEENPCNPNAKAFNWRDAKKVTPIKMQFSCGSCWAFTAAAAYETSYWIRNGKSIDISEQDVLACSQAGSCAGGWYEGVFRFWKERPAVLEEQDPYQNKETPCRRHAPTNYYTVAWGYVRNSENPRKNIPTVKDIKEALCKYGILASTVKVTDFFMSYKGGIYDEHPPVNGESDVNHGINIVGWDDTKKAWLIKNSWSTNWGEQGYMWIEYGSNNIGFGTMWVLAQSEILKGK